MGTFETGMPFLGAVGGIDDVVSGGEDGDESELGELGEGFRGERGFVGEDDIGVYGTLDDAVVGCAVVDGEFAKGFDGGPWVIAGVECVSIEDGDVHDGSLGRWMWRARWRRVVFTA